MAPTIRSRNICVDVTTNGVSPSAPHTLTNLDVSLCSFAAIAIEFNVLNVKVQNSVIHDNGFGVLVSSGSTPAILNNSFSSNSPDDIMCNDNQPGANGSGNTGILGCSKCVACPF